MKKVLSFTLALITAVGVFFAVPFTESPFNLTATAASTSDLTFKLRSDGESYEVDDCNTSASGSLTIPSTYNGLPVTEIGDYAFQSCSKLTSITIPNSVTMIGFNYVFSGCDGLTTITIPANVTTMGGHTFTGHSNLTAINVSSGNSKYTSVDGVVFNKNKTKLVRYPEGKTGSSYTIPSSVTSIGTSAFKGCTGLTSVTIPNSVTSIGSWVFDGCSELTAINVSSGNSKYTSIEGAVFNKNKTELVRYPEGKTGSSYTILSSVTSIRDHAFYGCTGLTSITISNGVTSIGDGAFRGCTGLTSITIPNSVTEIGGYAFRYCNNLKYVYYTGTQEEWNSVSIGDYNTPLTSATIQYAISSSHPYENNASQTWTIERDDAKYIEITFSDDTETESNYDYIYIYDKNSNQIGKYSGTQLAGQTVKVDGDKVTIKLTSDGSVTKNGFTVTDIKYEKCSHTSYAWQTTENATCTSTGSKQKVCSDCGKVLETATISATGHTWSNATCTSPKKCSTCGATSGSSLGHNYSSTVTKQPTCTSTGTRKYTCSRCSNSYTETISAKGHSYVNGTCQNCGKYLGSAHPYENNTSQSWTIERSGVDFIELTFSSDTKTESNYDYIYIYDKNNNQVGKYSGTQLAGQTVKVKSDKVTIKLTSDSSNTYYGFEITNIKSYKCTHSSPQWVTVQKPSCTSNGTKREVCSDCGYIMETKSISATGHTASAWITDQVATVNGAGSKHKACTVCGAVLEIESIPQLKPSTPKLSGVSNASSGVKVMWSKVDGADTYTVYRKDGDNAYKAIASGITSTSYTDKTAKSGTKYTYTVRGVNKGGYGSYNTTGKSITYIAMPKLSSVSNANGGVTFKWAKVTGAKGYYVYRKTGSGSWSKIADVTGASYTDKTAKSGTTYKYTVKAYNGKITSAYNTSGLSIKYLAMPNLSSASNVNGGVTVKWSKVTGASGYYVYRKSGNGSWKKLATVSGNSKVSYTDKTAKSGTAYKYTVRAYNGKTTSAYNTSGLSIKYLATPALEKIMSAKSGVAIKWGTVSGAKGYYVYRKEGNGSWKKIINVTDSTKSAYLDRKTKKGVTYTYTVQAYSGKTKSAYNTKGIKVKAKY